MTENQRTVEMYMDGFNQNDHGKILSCLTDDVEWILPGAYHLKGKAAFEREIENDAFISPPVVTTLRMIEQNDVVIAEGTVRVGKKAGGMVHLVFCDVFDMERGKIRRLTSYLMEVKGRAAEPGTYVPS
jgi:ketosteroid isomerase-like protein